MSWYQKRLEDIERIRPPEGRLLQMNFRITNPLSDKDAAILNEGLKKLTGISFVNVNLASKRLIVSYNTAEIGVEQIAYAIARLGYHYVQRA